MYIMTQQSQDHISLKNSVSPHSTKDISFFPHSYTHRAYKKAFIERQWVTKSSPYIYSTQLKIKFSTRRKKKKTTRNFLAVLPDSLIFFGILPHNVKIQLFFPCKLISPNGQTYLNETLQRPFIH